MIYLPTYLFIFTFIYTCSNNMAVAEEKLYCAPCHRKIHDIHKMAYESTDSGTCTNMYVHTMIFKLFCKYLHACDFFIKLCL